MEVLENLIGSFRLHLQTTETSYDVLQCKERQRSNINEHTFLQLNQKVVMHKSHILLLLARRIEVDEHV